MSNVPPLPTEISSDGKEIWDWASRLSDQVAKAHKTRTLIAQIVELKTTCGSCNLWMTRSCPREVHDNRKGRSSGPSCRAIKCEKFVMSSLNARTLVQAEEVLVELTKQ